MALIYNGILCSTIEELETIITSLSDDQKNMVRNDFNGIGNTSQTLVPSVTPRQMRIALVISGISIASIEAAIDSLPEPDRSITRITWEYSAEFQRNNPLLVAMAPALGLTSSQVDQLFRLAGTL